MVVSGAAGLGLVGSGTVSVEAGVRVPSAFFLVVYLGCMASAFRILGGPVQVAAAVAAVAIAVVLGYAGWAALPAALVVAASVLLSRRDTPTCVAAAVSRG